MSGCSPLLCGKLVRSHSASLSAPTNPYLHDRRAGVQACVSGWARACIRAWVVLLHQIQNVNVSKRRLKSVEDLSQCRSLARLNVAHNCLEGDLSFATFCLQLRWINASSNKLTTLGGLKNLSFLEVLNVSNNEVGAAPQSSHQLCLPTRLRVPTNPSTGRRCPERGGRGLRG
eukprot:GHVU01014005.1.p1 GENE.GHVU01014005.1~~GHVU01014005.1.p1  ORF type:complete len:173 (-),score=4.47 GHVU01014005.1:730-1248(-)